MVSEAGKKFTWVIKNFSSLGFDGVYSDIFVVGRCKWRLLAYPRGDDKNSYYFSLFMVVANHKSLPSGWRRHAKFSLSVVNQILGKASQRIESQNWFSHTEHSLGFPTMCHLHDLSARDRGFLVNGELKIVAEVDVLEVVGELDLPLVTTDIVDINGFQVIASQVETVNSLFQKHPNIASSFRSKNPHLRTTYLNILLSLNEILCTSRGELSNSDLADAYSSLTYVKKAGFKLDWLEKALKEVGETRIQDIEEELNDLTQKRADMDALLKFLK